ncbi:MAG TPA: hypothetical protein VFW65_14385 [Pseudonocardiaceae bacterium]|nr:hypothetical protein [Pseudonocardiaceae bacterium]
MTGAFTFERDTATMSPCPSREPEIAARFPDLTLRAEPAHQEAFVRPDVPGTPVGGTQAEVAIEALFAWASEH